jgi:alpha-1,2-mannosyltransferase
VFGWVIALLRGRTDNTIADDGLAIALWSLPVTMLLFGAAHIPIAMLVLPAFAGRLIWRLARIGARDVAASEVTAAPTAPSPSGRVLAQA